MKLLKRCYVFSFIACMAATVFLFPHYLITLKKLVFNEARIIKKTGEVNVFIDGAIHRGTLYNDVCKLFYPKDHERAINIPCRLIHIKTAYGSSILRIGADWIGRSASPRGEVESFFNWLILSETAETAYDLEDTEKGFGVDVVITTDNGNRVYVCTKKDDTAREFLRLTVPGEESGSNPRIRNKEYEKCTKQ